MATDDDGDADDDDDDDDDNGGYLQCRTPNMVLNKGIPLPWRLFAVQNSP